MDPNQDPENSDYFFELSDDEVIDESASVDDFIKELEAKEKDLHITAETTFIDIAADFEDGELPDFLKPNLPDIGIQTVTPAAAASAPDHTAAAKLEVEIAALKSKIATMEAERSELFENSNRRSKDFEAYKARTERERGDTFQKQLRNLATQMLPALDNLDRALKSASDMPDEKRNEFVQFFDGIVLVNQQVNEVLAGMGIMPIATVGEQFDPNFHEAVAIAKMSDFPPNTVCEELLRGFRIGDKIIRHSMVRVSQPSQVSMEPNAESTDVFGEIEFLDEPDSGELIDPADNREPEDTVRPADDE